LPHQGRRNSSTACFFRGSRGSIDSFIQCRLPPFPAREQYDVSLPLFDKFTRTRRCTRLSLIEAQTASVSRRPLRYRFFVRSVCGFGRGCFVQIHRDFRSRPFPLLSTGPCHILFSVTRSVNPWTYLRLPPTPNSAFPMRQAPLTRSSARHLARKYFGLLRHRGFSSSA